MGEEKSTAATTTAATTTAAKKRAVESLGWLTESTIMPRKHRAIEGVGASSILELKAQLYRSQEESKRNPKEQVRPTDLNYAQHLEIHRAKQKLSVKDSFSNKNSGVDARAAKDKLELKAVQDGSASYAALEKKAELYDKLMRGELSDEEDQEKYCVDFFRKGMQQDGSHMSREDDTSNINAEDVVVDDDDDGFLLNGKKAAGLGQASTTVDRSQHKHFVKEVHEEASQAREKVSELKLRRQEQLAEGRLLIFQVRRLYCWLKSIFEPPLRPDSTSLAWDSVENFWKPARVNLFDPSFRQEFLEGLPSRDVALQFSPISFFQKQ